MGYLAAKGERQPYLYARVTANKLTPPFPIARPFMSLRSFATLGLATMLSGAALAAPAPVAPAATLFKVGRVQVIALRDMINNVPNDGSVFGKTEGPAAVAEILRKAGQATDTLPLGVDVLMVRMPGRLVLIDTGLGPKAGGALLRSLALAKVSPADITDVLITHSHGDHVGGLSARDGGLAFPNAEIHMARAEWAWMRGKPDNAALVALITTKIAPFDAGAVVLPGIHSVPLSGHTPGHSGYEIRSGGQRLLAIGDTAHSAVVSLAKPDWAIGYDTNSAAGRQRRDATLIRLAASGERVFSPHFPYPGVGRIIKTRSGYRWEPAKP